MNPLWDFQVGDRVFCVWPAKRLPGGYYTVTELMPRHMKLEGFKFWANKDRFVKQLTYNKPDTLIVNPMNEMVEKVLAAFEGVANFEYDPSTNTYRLKSDDPYRWEDNYNRFWFNS